MYSQYIVIASAVFICLGELSYLRDTWHGTIQPNKISWGLWALGPLIGTAAALADGTPWIVMLPTFASGSMTFGVFLASFVHPLAHWKITIFDVMCGLCSLLALFLWILLKEPLLVFVCALVADIFATIPTLKKTYTHPETESALGYIPSAVGAVASLLIIHAWHFTAYAFPMWLLCSDVCMTFFILHFRFF